MNVVYLRGGALRVPRLKGGSRACPRTRLQPGVLSVAPGPTPARWDVVADRPLVDIDGPLEVLVRTEHTSLVPDIIFVDRIY